MPAKFRRLLIASATLIVIAIAAGCGGTTSKHTNVFPPLPLADADDVMQEFAMMFTLQHGGWLVDFDSTLSAVPLSGRPRFLAPGSTQSFTSAGMNYSILYNFTALHGDTNASWADTDSVAFVDGNGLANGTFTVDPPFNGAFHHEDDPIAAEGFASGDTITFSSSTFDSIFVTFTPVFRGGTRYATTTAFTDYDVLMLRDPLLHPFPISGTLTVSITDAIRANADPASGNGLDAIEAEIDVTFDGTQTAHAAVYNDLQTNPAKHFYTFDLRTGAIVRQ